MTPKSHKLWSPVEVRQAEEALPRVVRESGGYSISNKSVSLKRLAQDLGRSAQSVNNKLRFLAAEDSNYRINEYGPRSKKQTVESTPVVEEVQSSPVESKVVTIPLKKVYGKIDYETFMSLLNA